MWGANGRPAPWYIKTTRIIPIYLRRARNLKIKSARPDTRRNECDAFVGRGPPCVEARAKILKVGRDPRGYMREAYRLFNGEGSEEELRAVAANGPADEFSALLYVGLWREARGEPEAAKEAMVAAVQSPYGQRSGR